MVQTGLEPTNLWLLVWTAKPWSLLKSVLKYSLPMFACFPSSPLFPLLSSGSPSFPPLNFLPSFSSCKLFKVVLFYRCHLSLEITLNLNKRKWKRNTNSDTWTEAGDDPVGTISWLPWLWAGLESWYEFFSPLSPQQLSVDSTAVLHSVSGNGLIPHPLIPLDVPIGPISTLFQKKSFLNNAMDLLTLSLFFLRQDLMRGKWIRYHLCPKGQTSKETETQSDTVQ